MYLLPLLKGVVTYMHLRITAEKARRVSQLAGGCFVESKIPSPENAFHKREREQVGVVA